MKTLIESIVKYWSDFLKDPNSFQFDNGDKSKTGMMSAMLANMGKPKSCPRYEIDAFQEVFYNAIAKQLPESISIDYVANGILEKVADETLSRWSNMHTFPVKTHMNIDYKNQVVRVSQGYGAPTKIIFEGKACTH